MTLFRTLILALGLAGATALASSACAAIVVTEFNAEKDKDGSDAARVVDGLVESFDS